MKLDATKVINNNKLIIKYLNVISKNALSLSKQKVVYFINVFISFIIC